MNVNPWILATIVEGEGEVAALPLLLRRMRPEWLFPRPIRVRRNRIIDIDELRKYLALARANVAEKSAGNLQGGCLLLLDADEDCPAELGPRLTQQARRIMQDFPVEVVLAKRTYEAWLVGGRREYQEHARPEDLHNPANIIEQKIGRYKKVVDQPRLTADLNIRSAETRCPSFAKLCRALAALSPSGYT